MLSQSICSISFKSRVFLSITFRTLSLVITRSYLILFLVRHVEGGWPKDVDFTEPSDVNRFRKKAEKDEEYKGAVKNIGPIIELCMRQNSTVNIYGKLENRCTYRVIFISTCFKMRDSNLFHQFETPIPSFVVSWLSL